VGNLDKEWSLEDIYDKASWEGGLVEVARWGLGVSLVPESIREDWVILEAAVAAEDRIHKVMEDEGLVG
jgi:hypothetical protein